MHTLWLVGAVLAGVVGLLVGALMALVGWRYYARHVLGRDAGPTVPPMFMIGPGIASAFLLLTAFGFFRQWMGWGEDDGHVGRAAQAARQADGAGCDSDAIIAALAMTAVCAFMAWRTVTRGRQTARTPLSAIGRLTGGAVRIQGTAEALDATTAARSPLSGLDGLVVHSTLVRHDDDGSDTLVEFTSTAGFAVRDPTGVVTVLPSGAEFLIAPTLQWRRDDGLQADDRALDALAAAGVAEDDFPAHLQQAYRAWRHARDARERPAGAGPLHPDGVAVSDALPADGVPVSDAHRQALGYLAAMAHAQTRLDAADVSLTEQVIRAGDPVAVIGRFDDVQRRIVGRAGGLFAIGPSSRAFDRQFRGPWVPLAWAAGMAVGGIWLAHALACR